MTVVSPSEILSSRISSYHPSSMLLIFERANVDGGFLNFPLYVPEPSFGFALHQDHSLLSVDLERLQGFPMVLKVTPNFQKPT